ncbi:MAG: hypothetical protein VZQ98_17400 [Bacteroidales bacterium]|nr:hypothetical protein [Bacteroidales bacterium]
MNYKNNLSLILASTMVSGMFSAAVNATAYKFNNTTGNLAVHAVSSENVVVLEDSDDTISFELDPSNDDDANSQKFAFSVASDVVNENVAKATDNKMAAEAATIKDLKAKAVAATEKLNAAAKAGVATNANATAYAIAFRDAVEVMAEIKGEMSDKSNAKELVATVKDLVLAEANAYKVATNAGAAIVANNKFTAKNLPAGSEDAITVQSRLQRAIVVAAPAGVGTPIKSGICVGDVVTAIADGDARKYQVIGSAQVAGNLDVNAGAGAAQLLAAYGPANVGRITDANLAAPADPTGNVVVVNAGPGRVHANAQAFLENHTTVAVDAPAAATVQVANGADKLAQLTLFNEWMDEYFIFRARAFLTVAEAVPAGATNASWLGAGAAKGSLNNADDYGVTIALKKGSDAVAVRKHTYSKVALGGENGAAVAPIIVEFIPKAVTKNTTVEGALKITSAGKTQKIKVKGVVYKNKGAAYLAAQDDDSEAELLWDTSKDNEDENMPQSFIHVGQQNDAKKAGKEDEKEISIKMQIKGCPDQCNIL